MSSLEESCLTLSYRVYKNDNNLSLEPYILAKLLQTMCPINILTLYRQFVFEMLYLYQNCQKSGI